MKFYDFKYWIIGISSEADVMDAINAYFCLIGETNRVPELLDEFEGYKMARNEGYSVEGLEEIEADGTGIKVALIKGGK